MQVLYVSRYMSRHKNAVIEKMHRGGSVRPFVCRGHITKQNRWAMVRATVARTHQFHRAVLAIPFNTTSYTWGYCTHCNVAIYLHPGVFLDFDGCILKMILFQTERYGDDQTSESNGKQPFTYIYILPTLISLFQDGMSSPKVFLWHRLTMVYLRVIELTMYLSIRCWMWWG